MKTDLHAGEKSVANPSIFAHEHRYPYFTGYSIHRERRERSASGLFRRCDKAGVANSVRSENRR